MLRCALVLASLSLLVISASCGDTDSSTRDASTTSFDATSATVLDLFTRYHAQIFVTQFVRDTATAAGLDGDHAEVVSGPDSCYGVGGKGTDVEISFGPLSEADAMERLRRVDNYWKARGLRTNAGPFQGQVLTEVSGKNSSADWNVDDRGFLRIGATTGCYDE